MFDGNKTYGQLGFKARVQTLPEHEAVDRIVLIYQSNKHERFFGFGEQFSYFDLKGRRVPILVREPGPGRGISVTSDSWAVSYSPVPHYITSQLRSVYLENTEYSVFDLRNDSVVEVEVSALVLRGKLVYGSTPLELIRSFTTYAGRMSPLPPWLVGGAVVGMEGGREEVLNMYRLLTEDYDVPVTAFWLQDWVGARKVPWGVGLVWDWQWDNVLYPKFPKMVEWLRDRDVRVMTYVNPHLVPAHGYPGHSRDLFQESMDEGYVVRKGDGGIFLSYLNATMMDLSDPEARAWLKRVIMDEVLSTGVSGWMCDFGEALPLDAEIGSGLKVSGNEFHNVYPEEWAKVNLEAIEEWGLEEDVVFFTRSGFTRSPRYSKLFWLGDQLVTWEEHNGIKSAVVGMLSSGISGHSLTHGDIGGYMSIRRHGVEIRRSKELLLRWFELAAFTAVFRTHEGSRPTGNWQFYSDNGTLMHFARNAK
ncbi:unnamed protein product, partial [Ostreobium quekettii]